MQNKVLSLLSKVLGDSYNTTKDNHIFHCPNCNHRKKKLEIDVESGSWHCWVCDSGGHSLFTLFKWVKAKRIYYDDLRKIIKDSPRKKWKKSKQDYVICELPKEFIPLWIENKNNFYWKSAKNYLKSRGIGEKDILKYSIGYCIDGAYSDMIIIPSYNSHGKLNYFSSRSFLPKSIKFKNPPVSRDVVGFEMMINWKEPIILVESAFDAITIKRNSIPLFGKGISRTLKTKIIIEDVSEIIICLDADAIYNALDHADYFLRKGINIRIVKLDGEDDPSSLGYDKIWEKIDSSRHLSKEEIFEIKVKDHLYGKGKTNLSHRRRSLQTLSTSQRVSGSFRSNVQKNSGSRY